MSEHMNFQAKSIPITKRQVSQPRLVIHHVNVYQYVVFTYCMLRVVCLLISYYVMCVYRYLC